MTTRYEAIAVRRYEQNGEEKSAFTNIGVAFPMKERDGFALKLHCLPAPVDGEYSILLLPPKPREEEQQTRRQEPARRDRDDPRTTRQTSRELDDEIPF